MPDRDTTAVRRTSRSSVGRRRRVLRLSAAARRPGPSSVRGPVRLAAPPACSPAGCSTPVLPIPGRRRCRLRLDVTVIIPVARPPGDARSLPHRTRSTGIRVVVVDDGSADADAVARVAASTSRHGRERRSSNRRARRRAQPGLARVTTELVAFLDSDCIPPPTGSTGSPPLRRSARCGGRAARLSRPRCLRRDYLAALRKPRSRRPSCPGAARRAGFVRADRRPGRPTSRAEAIDARRSSVFDPALRYGEDVDLIWRLHAAGWRVRYDPRSRSRHEEPQRWPARLGRRFRYGTSAAPLARRHPDALAPLVLHPWPVLVVGGLLARRPAVAGRD